MKIAIFGSVDDATLKALKEAKHVILTTDHASDAKLIGAATRLKIRTVVARAEWHNLQHETSVRSTRVGFASGEPEEYNSNGGVTRDTILVEQADAVILGHGASDARVQLVHTSNKPFRQIEMPRLTAAEAEAQLAAIFN